MIDFYEELKDHLEDEYKDVISYIQLSKNANNPGEAQILKDIAREEYIHAGHLERLLKRAGKELPEGKERVKAAIDEI